MQFTIRRERRIILTEKMPSGIRAASGGNILALTLPEIWYIVPAGIFSVILMCLPRLSMTSQRVSNPPCFLTKMFLDKGGKMVYNDN